MKKNKVKKTKQPAKHTDLAKLTKEHSKLIKEYSKLQNTLKKRVIEDASEIIKSNRRLQEKLNEQKQVESSLEQQCYQTALLLNSAGEGICGIDQNFKIMFINPAAAKALGYKVINLLGRNFFSDHKAHKSRRQALHGEKLAHPQYC
ncbi:PAS domain-containing protein [Spirochaetota bacterium]